MAVSLDNVPQEVLEQIALFSATESFLGPPSSLPNLLLTCRRINASLTIAANPCLYGDIFAHKFDLPSLYYSSDSNYMDPDAIAAELRTRCLTLTQLRSQLDPTIWQEDNALCSVLLRSYIIMLENGGKNERQLREYARIDDWLKAFWFSSSGSSSALHLVGMNLWPLDDANAALGMWLFWFLFQTERYSKRDQTTWHILDILKLYALGAHTYELTSPSWTDFIPSSGSKNIKTTNHYGKECRIAIPPASAPAILSFMTLLNTTQNAVDFPTPLPSSDAAVRGTAPVREWQCEWGRCASLGAPSYTGALSKAFNPGSIEGAWEGCFTYTEFTAYAALLAGSPPSTLNTSLVVRHRQTWKLREYHLSNSSSSSANPDPVSPGDPLRSFFPIGTALREHPDSLEVVEPRHQEPRRYVRAGLDKMIGKEDQHDLRVVDVIIIGEGHSAWGQFNLLGRVRPCDGLISLSKEYVDGDRGRWLYRGYLVGSVNSNLSGRWRDTLSPVNARGYEGCFTMTRRR